MYIGTVQMCLVIAQKGWFVSLIDSISLPFPSLWCLNLSHKNISCIETSAIIIEICSKLYILFVNLMKLWRVKIKKKIYLIPMKNLSKFNLKIIFEL